MEIRHLEDSPGRRRVKGVSTSPGDTIEVNRELGRRLIQFAHLEAAEDVCDEPVNGFQCCRDLPCQYHSEVNDDAA